MNRIYYALKMNYSKLLKREADRIDTPLIEARMAVKNYYEDRLYVLFSRRIISEWLSYLFFAMAIGLFFIAPGRTYLIVTAALSLICFIWRFYYVGQYRHTSRNMNMGLALFKKAIFKEYKIYIDDDI